MQRRLLLTLLALGATLTLATPPAALAAESDS